MSRRTSGVAVAVSARIRSAPSAARAWAIFWYSGRKSWPQAEMQCASSTASRGTLSPAIAERNEGERNRSGAT